VCSFDLVDPAGAPLPAFEAGAHLDVHMKPGLRRQYSLCNSPSDRNKYQIAVLRDPASRGGSAYMHEQIQEGSELVVGLPRNRFALREDAKRSLLMAGGIGITPLLAMADRLHATGAAFELHAFARSASRAAFVDRLRRSAYAAAVHLHFDDQSPAGRPDLATIFSRPGSTDRLYICGPAGFIKACRTQALSAGWDASRVH
jgi:vanillate O-demethylase ferredoxin subunit